MLLPCNSDFGCVVVVNVVIAVVLILEKSICACLDHKPSGTSARPQVDVTGSYGIFYQIAGAIILSFTEVQVGNLWGISSQY